MDWKSKRVRTILESALIEDKATDDITTALTVDRKLRATASIVAGQPCVIAGLGLIPVLLELSSAGWQRRRMRAGGALRGGQPSGDL